MVPIFNNVAWPYCVSINSCEFLLLIVTPDSGTKIVLPEPVSIKLYLYPTGIATEEFEGIVKFIPSEVLRRMLLLTSSKDKVNAEVFVITVPEFKICGSRSNCKSTEFQSIPFPASSGYPPVAPLIAFVIDVVTNDCVAKFAVFAIPWTSVVSAL